MKISGYNNDGAVNMEHPCFFFRLQKLVSNLKIYSQKNLKKVQFCNTCKFGLELVVFFFLQTTISLLNQQIRNYLKIKNIRYKARDISAPQISIMII